MGFIKSSIVLQDTGLYKASIHETWLYFGAKVEHETFPTIGEARDWILKKRCPNHEQPEEIQDKVPTYKEMLESASKTVLTNKKSNNIQ